LPAGQAEAKRQKQSIFTWGSAQYKYVTCNSCEKKLDLAAFVSVELLQIKERFATAIVACLMQCYSSFEPVLQTTVWPH